MEEKWAIKILLNNNLNTVFDVCFSTEQEQLEAFTFIKKSILDGKRAIQIDNSDTDSVIIPTHSISYIGLDKR